MKTWKHKNLIPMQSPNFQEIVAIAINQIWWDWSYKEIYDALGLNEKKDGKDSYITDAKEMFNSRSWFFQTFIAWVIHNTNDKKSILDNSLATTEWGNIKSKVIVGANAAALARNLNDI